ncbi:unnamed protein product [Ranitomeya imitator]|uniref:EF-hand domain-containing protein n=1 Tax=Ranitomeya imitator TaxID=111125 RepID=A0ABN9LPT7_9NEOB|nr:unnamed protein product [Ranitomeya imitator]
MKVGANPTCDAYAVSQKDRVPADRQAVKETQFGNILMKLLRLSVFKACDEGKKGYLSREDLKVAVVMMFGYKPSKVINSALYLVECALLLVFLPLTRTPIVLVDDEEAGITLRSGVPAPQLGFHMRDTDVFLACVIPALLRSSMRERTENLEVDTMVPGLSRTGEVTPDEFVKLMTLKGSVQPSFGDQRQIFSVFDSNCRGFLNLDDFKRAFKRVAPHLPEQTIIEAFSLSSCLPSLSSPEN